MLEANTGSVNAAANSGPTPGVSADITYIARPGPGPVVVFLHGIGSNATSFAPIFELLPPRFSLIAWNAPGYSGSAPLAMDWPLARNYADRLAQMLDGLDLGQVHIVGHSLGTLIATAFARRFPKRLLSLTLAAAAKGYGVPRGGVLPEGVGNRLTELARLGPAVFAHARAGNLVHEPALHPDIVARVEAAMAQVNPDGYAQAVRMLASGDLPGDLARVAARPGFIVGMQDRVTPIAQTRAAAQAWEAAQGIRPTITEIDQAGHAVYLQRPGAFCSALLEHMGLATASKPEGT
ncbi:alpha/beta fold hydrolase [Nioella sp.]|uniref:alpha/beta fold hydrolase n=1 Tax=Nioella sp. TaxID=1912091 RepID=UPI003B52C50C